jgi:subtilase family serine protease
MNFEHDVRPGRAYQFLVTADVPSHVIERSEENNRREAEYRMPSGITDGGGSETVFRGVDLVVSEVEITRGLFGGREKIQIVPTIRNMWHGATAERIKILFDGLGMAEWVAGGIGPDETIRAGAVYIECDAALSLPLNFSVEVDSDNAIVETNDLNNRCGPIRFASGDTHVVHDCPISGPHEPLI